MVVSRIDATIKYPNVKAVDPEDLNFEAQLYEIEIFPDLDVIIALGQVKYTFVTKGVLYIPVYLTKEGTVLVQIGVYEFPADIYTSLLDGDNDFDIGELEDPLPLRYDFATESYVRRETKKSKKLTGEKSAEEPSAPPTTTADVKVTVQEKEAGGATKDSLALSKDSRVPNTRTIVEELAEVDDDLDVEDDTAEMEDEIKQRSQFKIHAGHNWVEKFLLNENYGIIDNESKGDCLFATIRDAFSGVGKTVSVAQLRKIVSDAATPGVFNEFKEHYDMYNAEFISSQHELTNIHKRVADLKKSLKLKKDRSEQKRIVDAAKPLIERFKEVRRDKVRTGQMLHEFRWMRGVESLADLKKKMRHCSFWGEVWTISTLERVLNIKLIILSSDRYEDGDIDSVLQCGGFFAPKEGTKEEMTTFKPKYYIMLDHTGVHYKLITYKRKRIFTFKDIPPTIKRLIVDKCMERTKGIYNSIPKFAALKEALKGAAGTSYTMKSSSPSPESGKTPVFDESTVFQFYSRSSDKPAPGRGAGEKIDKKDQKKYADLAGMTGWRKVLSNFYMAPFALDGYGWNSVEHYYQGNKFKTGNPEWYKQFTIESGSTLSKDPNMAKSAGGKTGKYKGKRLRPKEVTIDENFFSSGRDKEVMERGQMAKYSQNEKAKKILLATGRAKLLHHVRASAPIVFYDTMRVREKLKSS